jgi:hypothetical protein
MLNELKSKNTIVPFGLDQSVTNRKHRALKTASLRILQT